MSRRAGREWVLSRILNRRKRLAGLFPFHRRLRIEPLEDRRLLSITVTTLVDEADGSIVDGDISLRDAIALAPAGETIDFDPSLFNSGPFPKTLELTIGPTNSTKHLTIDKNLTINGLSPSMGRVTIC
jgi:hypothetical protein